ncbi:MAG: EAL domain-containing protein [Pseudoflavonifractor capillosus]|uniref:EAL domain-containing protein n=1 Tax=Pseudoflavonifractor capillosus TaxID=106588 RepID=UPI0023F634AE|nr:EAL domain-containing protein [Pseudoflavonifractor capillosus]MCI5928808.1 EAL domain-containing protein [Pseudoflavonifractor capillosus]MDY4660292.1 EAL domain-containing protein [Pseudoflavonifractor capillosus]
MHAQLEVLDILGEGGNGYLFLWDLDQKRIFIYGDIGQRYPIELDEENCCTEEAWFSCVCDKDLSTLRGKLEEIRQGKIRNYNREYRLIDRDGNRVWINCRGQCQLDEYGKPIALIGRVSDTVLEQKVDQLTGAFNAVKLAEDTERILHAGIPCFLLLLGVDNLKYINISHGREYGSRVLCLLADMLEELVGLGVRIYRVNGDCFAVNLPVSEKEEVEKIYQQLRVKMSEYCTISAGVVAYHEHHNVDSGALYQYAEDTLDKAKRMGKNVMAFFSQKDYEEKLSTVELQEELHRSIQNGFSGFSLRYQPQIQSRTYEIFGAEALLRYQSSTRGNVGPNEFIPVLEQTGMICDVGLWVLKTALNQCRIWREARKDIHVSVNISYTQLSQENIADQILKILDESGLPGDALTLEVTESIQLQDYPHFNKIFYQWKQAGIEISVDDFGTGYSSLGYLKNLDIDEIKIDRCFVSGIQHSAYNYRLLNNMVELAHSSQIRVCCEGVETRDELAALEKLGRVLLQGYLFNPPLTTEAFTRTYIQQDTAEYQGYAALKRELYRLKWNEEQLPQDIYPTTETLESIVEALDDIVYVSDIITYEMYYLNPAGRRLTGVHDYKGQKCYKVIQGRDDPCDFCTNSCLRKERFYIWEWDNKRLKRHFILKDKLIPWGGRLARLEIAVDITDREIISQAVREKLDFAENMLACAKALAEESDMEQATNRMLASVVEFYQADRAYLFEPESGACQLWSNTYEWCREGIEPERDNLQKLPASTIARWLNLFKENATVVIANLDELRESDPEEWEILNAQGIRRLLAVPIRKDGRLVSFLGVDNPRHCINDDSLIRMLSLFVVNRFSRNETEERLGELLDLHYRDVLKDTGLGLWFIRIDPQSDLREMFADETMRHVMGLEQILSPQECYAYWYDHINDGYYQYVNLAVESMARSRRVVQLEYPWQHPVLGEVMVRCTGIRTADTGGKICLEGYHRIISDVDRPKFLPETPTGEVFEFNERKSTIYFHTSRTLLAGEKKHESNFPKCWLENEMVHPHFTRKFASLFQNVQQAAENESEEVPLRTKKGSYEWFNLRIRHLGSVEQDRDTVLVLLDAAEQDRALQMENMRIREFYQASLSENIAYAEVDLGSGQLKASGGLWASYAWEYKGTESLLQFMRRQSEKDVQPDQKMKKLNTIGAWKELFSDQEPIHRFRYQRQINGSWRWVELVAHSFREEFTENIYALLYLKDIDAQVRKELAQQEAANRDPLTGVYNRNAFQRLVFQYMDDNSAQREGVLILLDIDNFKVVNDRFGHLEGDAVLRYVTKLLETTFRREDLVGRLGGDEFIVFLKGPVSRDILDQRMEKLYTALDAYPNIPISCSAGVTFIEQKNFSYTDSIQQADVALYKSKKEGKRHYTYVEEQNAEKTCI